MSSVLHKLDVLLVSVTGRSSLGSISHDGDLLVRFFVLNYDSGSYWIEVSSNIVSLNHIVVFSMPKLLVVHIKTIGINPNVFISVETIKELPVNNNILTPLLVVLLLVEFLVFVLLVVSNRNLIEDDIELDEIREV